MEIIEEVVYYDCKDNKPPIQLKKNNGSGPILDVCCLNYIHQRHKVSKNVWNYTCRSKKCNASISLMLVGGKPDEKSPTYLQLKHNHPVILIKIILSLFKF